MVLAKNKLVKTETQWW